MQLFEALSMFRVEMRNKLKNKEDEGWRGWDREDVCTYGVLVERLKRNVDQGDWVDVANLAMFLWYRKRMEQRVGEAISKGIGE